MEKFRSNLKEYRLAAGLTQEELAERAGVAVRTISAMETEEGANPQIGTLIRLMNYLRISFEELYSR